MSLVKLEGHTVYCEQINNCKIDFPIEKFTEFKNFVHKERTPFVLYADFEAMLKHHGDSHGTLKTDKYHKHDKGYPEPTV